MKKKIYKNIELRKLFNKFEKIQKVNKFLFIYLLNNKKYKNYFKNIVPYFYTLNSINKKLKARIRINRRCILTNRGRSIYRPYGLSRIAFRELIQFGLIPGYTKAVW